VGQRQPETAIFEGALATVFTATLGVGLDAVLVGVFGGALITGFTDGLGLAGLA
jgi:hypothetical protein